MRGVRSGSLCRLGRGVRTGHRLTSGSDTSLPCSLRMRAMIVWDFACSLPMIHVSSPEKPGGTRMRCSSSGVSWTTARREPGATTSPVLALGVMAHSWSGSICSTESPRPRKEPSFRRRVFRGLPIPSKICPRRPGPSETESGSPVPWTISPMRSPSVSS